MLKEAAVVLLHEKITDSLILTQRSTSLREHPGEYCFPGGRKDEADSDLWETATRELNEELGIDSERVRLMKKLHPEYTLHGKIIYPWLASIDHIEPFTMNAAEVTQILPLPISEVVLKKNYQNLYVKKYGKKFKSCQFTACSQFVWGATAKIMKQLCEEPELFQGSSQDFAHISFR